MHSILNARLLLMSQILELTNRKLMLNIYVHLASKETNDECYYPKWIFSTLGCADRLEIHYLFIKLSYLSVLCTTKSNETKLLSIFNIYFQSITYSSKCEIYLSVGNYFVLKNVDIHLSMSVKRAPRAPKYPPNRRK